MRYLTRSASVLRLPMIENLESRMLLSADWAGTWHATGIQLQVTPTSPSGRVSQVAMSVTLNIQATATAGVYHLDVPEAGFSADMVANGDELSVALLGRLDGEGYGDEYLQLKMLSNDTLGVFDANVSYDSASKLRLTSGGTYGGLATRDLTTFQAGYSWTGTHVFYAESVDAQWNGGNADSSLETGRVEAVGVTSLGGGSYQIAVVGENTMVFTQGSGNTLVYSQNTAPTASNNEYRKEKHFVLQGPDGRLFHFGASGSFNADSQRHDSNNQLVPLGAISHMGFDDGFSNLANFAPVLTATPAMHLQPMNEDDRANTGTSIASLLASAGGTNITDMNTAAVQGIALTSVNTAYGRWQYSVDGGTTWANVPAISDTSALLLASDAGELNRLRLVPTRNYNGTIANAITFHAWDQTRGTNGVLFNASATGGKTASSTATATASLRVRPVNDAPVLTGVPAATALRYFEGATPLPVLPGIIATDVDSSNMSGATVQITANYAPEDRLLFANTSAITGSFDALTGTLTLTGTASKADYQLALQSVRYRDVSQNPLTAARTISVTIRDEALTSLTVQQSVAVRTVNDAPVVTTATITLNGASKNTGFAITFDMLAAAIQAVTTYSDLDNAPETLGFQVTTFTGTLSQNSVVAPGGMVVLMPTQAMVWRPATDATGRLHAFQVRIWDGQLASVSLVDVFIRVV